MIEKICDEIGVEPEQLIIKRLQQENEHLKTDMEVLFNENSNKEKVIIKQNDNWNELKEYCSKEYYGVTTIGVLEKMKELEQGSDSNE